MTPIGKPSLMLGKLVPFALVGYVQMTVVMALGVLIFRIPTVGSVPLLYLLTVPFIVASLGVGLLISTIARNQVQAMQFGFFFMLPNILLSGYVFPRVAMPLPARAVTEVTVYCTDHAGLFSKISGALAVAGASIVDARIHTLTNGMALDTFWIQDGDAAPRAVGGATAAAHVLPQHPARNPAEGNRHRAALAADARTHGLRRVALRGQRAAVLEDDRIAGEWPGERDALRGGRARGEKAARAGERNALALEP